MKAWSRSGTRRASLSAWIALAITGCRSEDPATLQPAATPSPAMPVAVSVQPTATDAPPAGTDRVERVAIPPAPTPSPSATIHPRKDFVDPPLPAELNDDGGLKPLPPPPAAQR